MTKKRLLEAITKLGITEEEFDFYWKQFIGRTDKYIRKEPGKNWITVKGRLTRDAVIGHLQGDFSVGRFGKLSRVIVNSDGMVRRELSMLDYIAIDVDCHKGGRDKDFFRRLKLVQRVFPYTTAIQSSGSGGVHLYQFYDKTYDVSMLLSGAKARLKKFGVELGAGKAEIFPIPSRGFRLPFAPDSFVLDSETLEPITHTLKESIHYIRNQAERLSFKEANFPEQVPLASSFTSSSDKSSKSSSKAIEVSYMAEALEKKKHAERQKHEDTEGDELKEFKHPIALPSYITSGILAGLKHSGMYKHTKELSNTCNNSVLKGTQKTRYVDSQMFLDCQKILQEGLTQKESRHDVTVQLVRHHLYLGFSQDDTLQRINDWIERKNNGFSKEWQNNPKCVFKENARTVDDFYRTNKYTGIYKRTQGKWKFTDEEVEVIIKLDAGYQLEYFLFYLFKFLKRMIPFGGSIAIAKGLWISFGASKETYVERRDYAIKHGFIELDKSKPYKYSTKKGKKGTAMGYISKAYFDPGKGNNSYLDDYLLKRFSEKELRERYNDKMARKIMDGKTKEAKKRGKIKPQKKIGKS